LKYSGEEEELFCDFVLASAELGVPLRKQLLINTVIDYEKEKGMQSRAASLSVSTCTHLFTFLILQEFVKQKSLWAECGCADF